MGLCKCPKRQVTTQFCFEHRVNVCENCMVVNHTKCTVQSYLQWLKDSDFDSSCALCNDLLDNGDCVRLVCYHVFHWQCLSERQLTLPVNTAPGGHTCPTCQHPIFPPANLVSPVADVLRVRLGQVNWGRNELGLPLLLEEMREHQKFHQKSSGGGGNGGTTATNGAGFSSSVAQSRSGAAGGPGHGLDRPATPHSIVNLDSYQTAAAVSSQDYQASSRRPLLQRESPLGGSDRDDNKYKRRTPQEIFARWSRRFYAPSAKPVWRKTWFMVATGIVGFVCIVYVMATLGRRGPDTEIVGIVPNRNLPHAEE